jgi:hypothetical protein
VSEYDALLEPSAPSEYDALLTDHQPSEYDSLLDDKPREFAYPAMNQPLVGAETPTPDEVDTDRRSGIAGRTAAIAESIANVARTTPILEQANTSYIEGALPHPTGEGVEAVIKDVPDALAATSVATELLKGAPKQFGELIGGITRGVSSLVEGAVTPMNVALAGAAAAGGPIASKVIAGGFGAQMIKQLPEQIGETVDAAMAGKIGEAAEKGTLTVGNALMAGLATTHAAARTRVAPVIEKAVDTDIEKVLKQDVDTTVAETELPPDITGETTPPKATEPAPVAATEPPPQAVEPKVAETSSVETVSKTEVPSPTGIRNAKVDEERVKRGLPPRMEPLRRSAPEVWDEAMKKVDDDAKAGTNLVQSLKEKPRALNDVDTALLAHEQVTRQTAFDRAVQEVNDNPGTPEAVARLDEARNAVQEVYDIGQAEGTQAGRSLAFRKLLINEDFSLAGMESQLRAVANEGKPLTTGQVAKVRELHERLSQAEQKLQSYEQAEQSREVQRTFENLITEQKKSARAAAKTGKSVTDFLDEQAAKARERIIARRGRLNVTVDPLNIAGLVDETIIGASHIAKGVTKLADWSAQMVKDFGERIKPYLGELYAKAKELHDANTAAVTGKVKTSERIAEESIERRKKATQTRLGKLEEKLATGDTSKTPRKQLPTDKELLSLQAKYERVRDEYKAFVNAEKAKNAPFTTKARRAFQETRGIILGGDFGMLMRQGLFSWSRPLTAIKATKQGIESVFSPQKMKEWEITMREREINGERVQPKRKAAGLSVTDTLNHHEELVIARFLKRIPGLTAVAGALERGQTTFINSVRMELFDSGVRKGFTPEELKTRANYINSATGRSNAKNVPVIFSEIMTSPRYEMSRWEMLAQPVRNVGVLAKQGLKGNLDKAALANLQDMAVTAAGIYSLYKIAELAGYTVTWNPKSSDFGKMRKGDEVWDVTAGMAPRLRDTLRLYTAFTHPSYSENIGKTALGAGLRTINPAVRTPIEQTAVVIQRARGNAFPKLPFNGFKSEEDREGFITLAPLVVQSMKQAIEEEGIGTALSVGAREFIGTSVQRYPERKPE